MIIYTIGHSTRTLEELIQLLRAHRIKMLVDVRRFPTSKKYPHFEKGILADKLAGCHLQYLWLEELGGFRKGGYKGYMASEGFKEGLRVLLEALEEGGWRSCALKPFGSGATGGTSPMNS